MPAKESSLLSTLRRRLKKLPRTTLKKFHSSAIQRDVDLLIVTHGMALLFELKRPGEASDTSSNRAKYQSAKLRKWKKSARYCGTHDNVDEIVDIVVNVAEEAKLKEHLFAEYMNAKK